MNREYHRWYSPTLQRDMELLVFGHGGARVLIFPTSRGRYFEWEDRGMMHAFRGHIERGWLQVYCVDAIDGESWYAYHRHPGERAWRHELYDRYLSNEVLPLTRHKNGNPFLITVGASFGAYHALNFALKHPDQVSRAIGLSGLYDIRKFVAGHHDDNVYFNNPVEFIRNESDGSRLAALRRMDIVLVVGRDDGLQGSSQALSHELWGKGIGNALRLWDGWAHDWPYWTKMLHHYIGGHD